MEKKSYEGLINELKVFSFSFAAGMVILTAIMLYKNQQYYIVAIPIILASYHLLCGLLSPILSWPFYKLSKIFFVIISFFLTIVVFSFIFYAIITPISFILRLSGKDHIKNDTGWIKREINDPKKIKKQY